MRLALAGLAAGLMMTLAASAGAELLIYGPEDRFRVGIDCDWKDERSVCAPYGTYGDPRSESSIWNRFGPEGNPTRFQSPWHDASLAGPELVTARGALSRALFHSRRRLSRLGPAAGHLRNCRSQIRRCPRGLLRIREARVLDRSADEIGFGQAPGLVIQAVEQQDALNFREQRRRVAAPIFRELAGQPAFPAKRQLLSLHLEGCVGPQGPA